MSNPAPDTRTKAGRDALDAAVLAVLQSCPAPFAATAIARETGASLLQVRASVRRLGRKVTKTGHTRAMVYSLAGVDIPEDSDEIDQEAECRAMGLEP